MKIVNSNKRYSLIIAGILILSILSIFLAATLDLGNSSNDKNSYLRYMGSGDIYVDNGNNDNVSVAQSQDFDHIDTDTGYIDITDSYLPETVPLCLDNGAIDDWFIEITTCGGYYIRSDITSYVNVLQKKADDGSAYASIGTLNINIADITPADAPCCCKVYNLTFTVEDDGCIAVDSNHFPWTGINADGWSLTKHGCNLNKWVELDVMTYWCGCHCWDQNFEIILTHKGIISGIPQLPY